MGLAGVANSISKGLYVCGEELSVCCEIFAPRRVIIACYHVAKKLNLEGLRFQKYHVRPPDYREKTTKYRGETTSGILET